MIAKIVPKCYFVRRMFIAVYFKYMNVNRKILNYNH